MEQLLYVKFITFAIVISSLQVELTWEASLLLMEYFHPPSLPSVEDNKNSWGSLSADVSIHNNA